MVNHSSRILLSKSALKSNLTFLRKKVGQDTEISAVLKANAYGHGIVPMTIMLEDCGINHFSVASAFEAEEVLEVCSPDSTIMIMGVLYDRDMPWAIENEIEFYVFNFERLEQVLASAKKVGKKALIHVEVETGTNRTGMSEKDFSKTLTWIKKNEKHITLQGICTHLGGAESSANDFKIRPQIKRFHDFLKTAEKRDIKPNYRHMACSAAVLSYPETQLDLVRVGIALYGFWPSPETYYQHLQSVQKTKDSPLKRLITWKTDVMDIKKVEKGEFIGYGTAFQALKAMTVAVMPLGYCNGFSRGLSNRGYVLINGVKAPIVGLVNMNLFMVDISHINDVEVGDEVVLLGKQKNNVIKVNSFSQTAQLLNPEMLARLPAAIPRKIVK